MFAVESEDEDVLYDKRWTNRSLEELAGEMKKGQRFDEKVFEDAGGLLYEMEEVESSDGVFGEVGSRVRIEDRKSMV